MWGRALPLVVVLGCSNASAPTTSVSEVRARFPDPSGHRDDLRVTLSVSARAPLFIEREPGVSLSIVADEVRDVAATKLDDQTFVYPSALAETDLVQRKLPGVVEELRWLRGKRAEVVQRYRITLGSELRELRAVGERIEALDANGVARLRSEPAVAIDAAGAHRTMSASIANVAPGVFSVTYRLESADLVPPIAIDPAWTTTADLPEPRAAASAVTLSGKKVIVIAGQSVTSGDVRQTVIYDAATTSWTTGPSVTRSRLRAGVVTLEDGRVMICGGRLGTVDPQASSDLYDPKTGKMTSAALAPYGYTVVRGAALPGNKAYFNAIEGAAVYDATADSWKTVTPLAARNSNAMLVRLPSGKLMIFGGGDASGAALSSAELFDPSTNTFSPLAPMPAPRSNTTADLANGKVIVIGGGSTVPLDTTLIYDPVANSWSSGPKLAIARHSHSTVVLPDGRVFVVGGDDNVNLLKSAEMLDAAAAAFSGAGSLLHGRTGFPMVPLDAAASAILVIGGGSTELRKDVEVFTPVATGAACSGAAECISGACVDGFCCDKSACAADETCGGTATPGTCRKKNGVACTTGDTCGSGQCVDGVCCDRACTDTCEACDVASSKGSCTTLAPGDKPHGARACPGTGVCAGLCGGLDAKSCTVFPGASTHCADASCEGGQESLAAFCDGAGACAKAATNKCEPYACGEAACKKGCTVDADCASGYTCAARTGVCVFGANCDGDHTVLVSGGASIDCTPYRCAGAACLQKCASSSDCVAGTTCETSSGTCEVSAASDQGGGGCSMARDARLDVATLLGLIAFASLRRRR